MFSADYENGLATRAAQGEVDEAQEKLKEVVQEAQRFASTVKHRSRQDADQAERLVRSATEALEIIQASRSRLQ